MVFNVFCVLKWMTVSKLFSLFFLFLEWQKFENIRYFWHDKPNYILDSWLLETFVLIMIFTTYCFYLTWSLCWKVNFTENSIAYNVHCITSLFTDLLWPMILICKYKIFSSYFSQVISITHWCLVIRFGLSISHSAIQVQEETIKYVYQCAKSLWTSLSLQQLTSNLWMNKLPIDKQKTKQHGVILYVIAFMVELMTFASY